MEPDKNTQHVESMSMGRLSNMFIKHWHSKVYPVMSKILVGQESPYEKGVVLIHERLLEKYILIGERDPAKRTNLCISKLKQMGISRVSEAINSLRMGYNAIRHQGFFSIGLLLACLDGSRILFEESIIGKLIPSNPIYEELFSQLRHVVTVIIEEGKLQTKVIEIAQRICKNNITQMNSSEEKLEQNHVEKQDIQHDILIREVEGKLPHGTGTLRSYRDEYNQALKGKKIEFLDGKHQGEKAIFKSWSGTTVFVHMCNEDGVPDFIAIGVPIKRNIKVLDWCN